jgi:hypothetical protein
VEDLEGAVYIYYGGATGITLPPTIIESNKANTTMSNACSAGDVNGDGYSDVIISAIRYSNGETFEGAVYIHHGSQTGISLTPSIHYEGNQDKAFLGNAITSADVNADGYSDIILGAVQYDAGQINNGAAFIYYGNKSGGLQNNTRLYNSNLTTPINQSQHSKPDFGAGLFAKSFLGKNKGKLVWETKAKGQGFSKASNNMITNSTQSSGSQSAYVSLGLTGTELKSVIAKQGTSTKVRVRVKYDPALAITGQIYGPWRYLPAYLTGSSIEPAPEELTHSAEKKENDSDNSHTAGKEINLYPNPITDQLHIESEGIVKEIEIYNNMGLKVHSLKNKNGIREVDFRHLSPGMYIIHINEKAYKVVKK